MKNPQKGSKIRILVTGGLGFIGSHFVNLASTRENKITILDSSRLDSKILHPSLINLEVVRGDIRDYSLVERLIKNTDVVIHLAASLGVKRILKETIESIDTNIHGSENILKASKNYMKRILIASTSEIYGKNSKQPLSETDDRLIGNPQNIRWTYSDSKAIEEAIAQVYFDEYSLPVTTIRFFNTVGPGQNAHYGMVLPKFVSQAMSNLPLEIHGDGTQTRVFCDVRDAVFGLYDLIENENTFGEVFNIGGIGEISIENLAKKVISCLSSKSTVEFIPYSIAYGKGYEDMMRRVPNIKKIQQFTGWFPKLGLETTITDISSWMKVNGI